VETMINKIGAIEPAWLMVLLLVGIALAVLLLTVRARRGRHKDRQRCVPGVADTRIGNGQRSPSRDRQRSTITPQTALQQGPHGEAEATYRAQIKKAKEDYGPEDPQVVRPMRNLAMLYRNLGKYSAAEPLLHRSLAIMEKADPENIETSAVLEQLAGLCEVQGRYAATELILQRSLTIRERALGPDHPHVTPLLEQIAMLYRKVGRTRDARTFEERAKTRSRTKLAN